MLETLAGSLSVALENARLVHETRQRNAELALINSVQEALAGELEMQAIYDVVGDKIQEIFDTQGVAIATVDETTGLVSFPYLNQRGERLRPEPTAVGPGFTKHVFETREPLLINENIAAEAKRYGSFVVAGEIPKSVLWVPLISGGRASGVISLDNFDREHAFTEADQRLLITLASSLSVALENARLVHETRQRNAELALINSVQDALAGELELQAIYDAVGDEIREVFDAQVVDIAIYDEASGLLHFPYNIERGERLEEEPIELFGFRKHVLETRAPLLIDEITPELLEDYGNPPVLSGEPSKSGVWVPLISGGKPSGVISLQNVDRPHAFTDSDQQLLETLAASLSVALENARLVHETRQRNAELALINSVQEALAGELEMQAIYDVVGRQDPGDLRRPGRRHRHLRLCRRADALPVHDRAGCPLPRRADAHRELVVEPASDRDEGSCPHQRRPCPRPRAGRADARRAGRAGAVRALRPADLRRRSSRTDLAAEPRPDERVLRERRPPADDPGGQSQRRARERAAGARDAAAERRAGADQQRAGRDRGRARPAGDLRRASATGSRRSSTRRSSTISTLDEATGLLALPVHHRARRAARGGAGSPTGFRSTCWRRASRC